MTGVKFQDGSRTSDCVDVECVDEWRIDMKLFAEAHRGQAWSVYTAMTLHTSV
jgi:hypothetical protein